MEGKLKPRALLIFGAPCSGKTTFAEKFAARFDIAFFNLDDFRTRYNLSQKAALAVVSELAKTKQTLIIEGGLETEHSRNVLRKLLKSAGYQPFLVWIQTDASTIRGRLKTRHKVVHEAKAIYDSALSKLEAPAEFENPIILSGKHTFETQVKHILAGLVE